MRRHIHIHMGGRAQDAGSLEIDRQLEAISSKIYNIEKKWEELAGYESTGRELWAKVAARLKKDAAECAEYQRRYIELARKHGYPIPNEFR